jgi:hypothetical protein
MIESGRRRKGRGACPLKANRSSLEGMNCPAVDGFPGSSGRKNGQIRKGKAAKPLSTLGFAELGLGFQIPCEMIGAPHCCVNIDALRRAQGYAARSESVFSQQVQEVRDAVARLQIAGLHQPDRGVEHGALLVAPAGIS